MVAGSYCRGLVTFTWSVQYFHSRASLIVIVSQLSLFVYDVLTAMGGILDVRWAHNGIVTVDPYCTAQGVLQQIGDVGVALITLVCTSPLPRWLLRNSLQTDQILTVHTFVVVLWDVGSRSRCIAFGVVALATLFIALRVGLSTALDNNYEMPTPVNISIYSPRRLIIDIIWLVLVLDWTQVQMGTLGRRIYLALDGFACLSDIEHPTLYLG